MISGYLVKKPRKDRKTFSIIPYSNNEYGKKLYLSPIQDEALTAINLQLKSGLLTLDQATDHVYKIILPRLKKEALNKAIGEARIAEQNRKLFLEFWASEYAGKKILRPEIARNDFIAALEGIGSVSLAAASKDELQKKLDKAFPENNRNNRYGAKLNQVLRFLKRDFSLYTARKDTPLVSYLTINELQSLLTYIEEPEIKDLCSVLFCTGVRLGEAFTLKPRDLKPNDSIFIRQQLTHDGRIRDIKNRKPHNTILLPEGRKAFLRWSAIEDKSKFRFTGQSKIISAAKKAFADKERQISPHDLRHSFAIHLLGIGVPLDKVARLLGDSLKTTEEHYTGFVMSDNEINFVSKIIKGRE
jgi:integrase